MSKASAQQQINEFVKSDFGVKIIKAGIVMLITSVSLIIGLILRGAGQNGNTILLVSLSLQLIACVILFMLFKNDFLRISGVEIEKDKTKEAEEKSGADKKKPAKEVVKENKE